MTGDGCRISFRFDGPEDAPCLLLSNSLGTDITMWAPNLVALSAEYHVLRYDGRGHGASDAPVGSYSIDRLGCDVIELLDALKIDTVAFCGLSLGGMVGQWLAIREPSRLRKLVLANTSGRMGPRASWDARIASVRKYGMAPLTDASVERWFTPPFSASAPEVIARIRETLISTDPVGYAGACAAIRDMDMRRTATLINVPTMVIGGTLDPATPPPHAQELSAAISGAQLIWLEAAHLSNVERPSEFSAAVLAHLNL